MKTISVAKMGEEVRTFAVEDNATVEDVLEIAGYSVAGGTAIFLNGSRTALTVVPADGSMIALTINAKNGQ